MKERHNLLARNNELIVKTRLCLTVPRWRLITTAAKTASAHRNPRSRGSRILGGVSTWTMNVALNVNPSHSLDSVKSSDLLDWESGIDQLIVCVECTWYHKLLNMQVKVTWNCFKLKENRYRPVQFAVFICYWCNCLDQRDQLVLV